MSLLTPGAHRSAGALDDDALVAAMVAVEVAWLRALEEVGAAEPGDADRLAAAEPDLTGLVAATEGAGNPVVPLVARLRAAVGDDGLAGRVHRGLTSQDVLDTALVLLSQEALRRVRAELTTAAEALAAHADRHRGTVMAGRTLTQHAVPVTFGLKAAQWLAGVLDARDAVAEALAALPVQCGGAAGTLALVEELGAEPVAAAEAFARACGLAWPGLPWHTNRSPVVRIGGAVAGAVAAVGVVGTDVALLARPEIAELREASVAGRGGSSTMPHKQNPVLSILVRSAALQAPLLQAQLQLAAGQAVDERPDGAWHSEWPALVRLLDLAVVATAQAAELVAGLEVDAEAMARRVDAAAADLLAERGGGGTPRDYLGAADAFVDTVLARVRRG